MNWPTGLDLGTADGMEIALLSQTIYEEVLKACDKLMQRMSFLKTLVR